MSTVRFIRRAGFTVVEAMLSCVIIGVAIVPAVAMLGATASDGRAHRDLVCGTELARQLLAEIVQCRYTDPDGSESGETRATWDDISDYNGLVDSPPTTKSGVAIPGFSGWTRAVTVATVNVSAPDTTSGTDLGLNKITVTVTAPSGKSCTLSALRSNGSAYERPPPADGTYTASVNVILQAVGGDPAATGVSLPNLTP